jgi:hypothetical protein
MFVIIVLETVLHCTDEHARQIWTLEASASWTDPQVTPHRL